MWQRTMNDVGSMAAQLYAELTLQMDVHRQAPLPQGPKIIASNHPSTTDPFLMMGLFREPIHILITQMCFEMPALGKFLQTAGHVPVPYENGRVAFEQASRLLQEGHTVGIFPEGDLSPLEGGCCPAHTGVARLALANHVPVVPMGIHLQRDYLRFRRAETGDYSQVMRWYSNGRYLVTTGHPLRFSGDCEDRPHVRAVTQTIMQQIENLVHLGALRMSTTTPRRFFVMPAFSRLFGLAMSLAFARE